MSDAGINYRVKKVVVGRRTTPIILQNYNGPCPLISVVNTLLLKGEKLNIQPDQKKVSNEYLLQILAQYILEYGQSRKDAFDVQKSLDLLPKIKDGLDVNVRFTGINDFDAQPEIELFKMLKVHLVHGWLIDPQDCETYSVIKNLTYNEIVEKFLLMEDLLAAEQKEEYTNKDQDDTTRVEIKLDEDITLASDIGKLIRSPDELRTLKEEHKKKIIHEGRIIGNFLERDKSQLTVYGLSELHVNLEPNNLCILFHNNHFSTVCKYQDHLYQLCTDEGFKDEPNIVWERLSEVLGDNQYYKGDFTVYQFQHHSSDRTFGAVRNIEQNNSDFELAKRLQKQYDQMDSQQQQVNQQNVNPTTTSQPVNTNTRPERNPSPPKPTAERVATIREKRNVQKPTNVGNNRYAEQKKVLQSANQQRIERQEQRRLNPAHTTHNKQSREKKDDGCTTM
ncbi:hypothetical protein AKO1_007322 [Acrasis kona]|uniref:MINDY deubiquitinase domain-containing protein n=1 Tax=Acrasis kona TaxID=1008807 RepID=A0AAW2YRH8_9EUKA